MKKIFYLSLLTLLSTFLYTCKDPARDIRIDLYGDIFKNGSSIRVLNAKDGAALPSGISVTITGKDAGSIFNSSGTRTFTVGEGGLIQFFVDPHREVTAANPVTFNVMLTGASILDMNIPVTISSTTFEERPIYIADLTNLPAGMSVKTETIALSGNSIGSGGATITTAATNGTTLSSSLILPAGTQFKNASGAVIAGGSLKATIVYLDVRSAAALRVFPGGSLSSNSIKNSAGDMVSGTFNPATVTDIELSIGNESVVSFSQPVQLIQDIIPTYTSSTSGQAAKVGDIISVYSYQEETGVFTYEKPASVVQHGSNLALDYSINHLTTYLGNDLESACTSSSLNLTGSWMKDGVTYTLKVAVKTGSGNIAYETVANITTQNRVVQLPAIPASNVTVVVTHSASGQELANTPVTVSCGGGAINVALSPLNEEPVVSLQLYVRCPGQSTNIGVLPTFVLYYKETGSSGSFQLLGQVQNGFISTTVLDPAKHYDFRATWNDKTKTVNNKQVKAVDINQGTVGDPKQDPSFIIGQYAPENNLRMLEEACNNL